MDANQLSCFPRLWEGAQSTAVEYKISRNSFVPGRRRLAGTRIIQRGSDRIAPTREYLVHDAQLHGLFRGEILVPLHHLVHLLDAKPLLPGGGVEVTAHNVVDLAPYPRDLLGIDDDIRGLALRRAEGLMHHDLAVRQGVPLTCGAAKEQDGAHRCGHTDAYRMHRRGYVVHGVVDCQARRDLAAGAVDVQRDGLVRTVLLEPEQLGSD
ncbi:hypothetical protein PgNI_05824 [Pyricularia grisea]|uniref:Uncharacterized protein n=1 Tax=Pyricularia grisea TaxID=148305 RepID=A0A6P8B7R5_PYRGI|nr:hypothetical protein PgNI_05824 [Pyricularia grisea]TLD11320.1 hypothetical protein PgNI_05824 [Pyricularia grisea]